MRRTTIFLGIAGALLAAVCGCAGAKRPASSALSWHRCAGRFQCATMRVPVSYSDRHGPKIPVSVVELAASKPHTLGDIVFNPGGPGESGVQFLEGQWSTFPASLRARFNLVSFDPRGDGSSEPLHCLQADEIPTWLSIDPSPTTPRQINYVVGASKAFIRGCKANASSKFIASLSTANNARDMESLRVALGQPKLTYYGFSYGTVLGTVYAEMFPRHIRAMVLDGALDPALDTETTDAEQAAGFETNLHGFFAWCARDFTCAHNFSPKPAQAYAALMDRFKGGLVLPANLPPAFGGREPVNYGTALAGVIATLYQKETWPLLGQTLAAAEQGDGTYLAGNAFSLAGQTRDGSFSNVLSASTATSCLDRTAPTTIRAYKALASRLAKSAPNFGAAEAWSSLLCTYWPGRATTPPRAAHAPGAPPILVVGSTGDPATRYAWAQALATQLPRATLLTRNGPGHTAYGSSSCIRTWADRYLQTLHMPPAGTVCPTD
jgi:pimeloyl-ACP methyl ester carboxylesterase